MPRWPPIGARAPPRSPTTSCSAGASRRTFGPRTTDRSPFVHARPRTTIEHARSTGQACDLGPTERTRGGPMLHVDIPTHAQLERLLRARHPASVSIYVPTTPITAEVAASRIDLRNAIEEALDQLRTVDLDKRQLADLEERLTDLVDDDDAWRLMAHSLAVFATPER